MAQEEPKDEIRVEDRRLFDKDGNVIRSEEPVSEEKKPREKRSSARSSQPEPPEKINFVSILFSYVHTALICLGDVEDPIEKKKSENLAGAREMIDILELMQDKTKGNLDPQEQQYLDSALYDLRMRFVQKSKIIK
ncbi:MAG TPA: DUF1844 domain-containing protein [Acidobacteriota bacterium]|nr:DUF1844 domain-containing protein [Acidobacteriota bacterium]